MNHRVKYLMMNLRLILISSVWLALTLASGLGISGCQTYTSGLKQSVARANETSAIAALRSIVLAQQTYSVSNGGQYGTFQQLAESNVLDPTIDPAKPEVKEYVLTMTVSEKLGGEQFYSCNADPQRGGDLAGRHFYIDSTSTEMRVNTTQPATAKDPTYQP